MNVATHPTLGELKAFALGKLAEADRLEIEAHVATCDACVGKLSSDRDEDSLVHLARQAAEDLSPSLLAAYDKLEAVAATKKEVILPDLPAELLDHPRYEVKRRLGAGGMGVVYHAQHRMMDRSVALKVMNPAIMDSPEAIERFRREVKAAAKLNHPNIVTAFDADQAGNLHFLVMEYLDGLSLDRWVGKKGPLPVEQAAYFIRLAALGLQHAFLQGMVHRDIKPQNLFVTRKGQVKILDFGLARLAYGEGNKPPLTPSGEVEDGAPSLAGFKSRHQGVELDRMTMTSAMLGTPDFVAPEQARDARNVDIRADLYSLGCTFYFLLSGRVPFPVGTLQERLMRHCLEEPTPIEKLRPDLRPEVVGIVKKLMAKRPGDRYQTPAELAAALLPFAKLPSALPVPSGDSLPPLAAAASPSQSLQDTSPTLAGARTLREPRRGRSAVRRKGVRPRQDTDLPRWLLIGVPLILGLIALVIAGRMAWNSLRPRLWPPTQTARESADTAGGNADQGGPLQPEMGGRTFGSPSVSPPIRTGTSTSPAVGRAREHEFKVLFVLPRRGLWLPDYEPVRQQLEATGCKCGVATLGREPSVALGNERRVSADFDLGVNPTARPFDVLIFVGAETEELTQGAGRPWVAKLLDEAQREGKLLAAICKGQAVLQNHGLLAGKRVARNQQLTREQGYRKDLQLVNEPAVTDGNIVTGAGPEDAVAFTQLVLRELKDRP